MARDPQNRSWARLQAVLLFQGWPLSPGTLQTQGFSLPHLSRLQPSLSCPGLPGVKEPGLGRG